MALKDVCDVTRMDGGPVSGTPLPPFRADNSSAIPRISLRNGRFLLGIHQARTLEAAASTKASVRVHTL